MTQYKYIAQISKNELRDLIVIPCITEDGMHTILVKNEICRTTTTKYSTDNLIVKLNAVLIQEDEEYYFHIISSVSNDEKLLGQFNVIYNFIFKKFNSPILDNQLSVLISSLEEYFKISKNKDVLNLQIGVFGELFTIKYLYEAGYDSIFVKFHNNFFSKHDFELDSKTRLEVKTTTKEKRIHRFKHNQLVRGDINVYISSLMIELSKEGYSLYQLFEYILNQVDDPDLEFSIYKIMKKCDCTIENQGIKTSIEKVYDECRIFSSNSVPKLEESIPNGISYIEYDVDCTFAESIDIRQFVESMKN